MSAYPVTFRVDRPVRFTRVQLAIRLVLFIVLGILGVSLGLLFLVAYLALPVIAAVQSSEADDVRESTRSRVGRALQWCASLYAYFGLLTDTLPTRAPDPAVHLEIARTGRPDGRGAMRRIITGIPSALVLGFLGCIGGLVWLIAAIEILVAERADAWTFRYLEGVERWMLRLLAYQACLVDEYPPFSLGEHPDVTVASAHG